MFKKHLLLLLLFALIAPWAANAQTTVTIGDPAGTGTNAYLPMYSFYNYSYTQQIYEACEIGTAGTINSVTLWLYNSGSNTLPTFDFDIYMVETTQDAFASTSDWVSVTLADIVYSGTLTVTNTTAQAYTFTLTTPFEFSGRNNLMIAFDNKTGGYKSGLTAKAFAKTGVNCSHYVYRDAAAYTPLDMSSFTGYISVNRDVIAFDMNPDPSVVMCCPVENLKAEDVEAYTARLTWESDATDFVVEYKKATDQTWTTATASATANGYQAQLSGLTPETAYNARVKVDCGGGDYSVEKTVNFTTLPSCLVPTGFGTSNLTYQSITLNWTSEADAWDVMLVTVATDPANNDTAIIAVTENPYTLTGLTAEQAYTARVRANCGIQDGVSAWTSVKSFTTLNACVAPSNLTCTALTATTATLSWFERGDATEWEVMYILGTDTTRMTTSNNPCTISGLTTEGYYTAKVRPTCSADAWSSAIAFEPTEKWVVGAYSTSNSSLPANNYYKYSLSQQIYTPAELGEAAAIFSIDFFKIGTTAMTKDLTIYILPTNKTEFANNTPDWIQVTADDVYFHGMVTFADNAWTTITLNVPFAYDGTSNLAIVVDNNTGGYVNSTYFRCYTASAYQSRYQQSDTENLDPTTALTTQGSRTTTKNMIRLVKGEMPSCLAPNGLTCTAYTANTATLDWNPNGNETSWVIQYSTDAEFATSSEATANAHPFELTGLTAETVYYARVKAGCDSDWSATCTFMPTARIVIGEATATSTYLPAALYYYNSLTEQIYTVAELGDACMIESIDFYSNNTANYERTFDIYMVSTENSEFANDAKAAVWIPVTAADLVYSGTVTITQGWNNFQLAIPFFYDGTKNVAVMIDTHSESYENGINFTTYAASNQAIQVYSDGTNYDPFAPATGTLQTAKNQIRILKGELPDCMPPTGLTVNYTSGTTAQVSWTSDATAWNLMVNDSLVPGPVTNPYPLSGLAYNTTYDIKVQNVCGESESVWVGPVSFTTEVCGPEDKCNITINLYDSYGDGWNGAYLLVYDYLRDELLGSYTLSSSASTNTLSVCDGRMLAFVWSAGSYDSECSFEVLDVVGDVVISQSGAFTNVLGFTVNCNSTCRTPIDFEVTNISGHSVELSWTEVGEATTWILEYMATTDEEITYDTITANPYTLTGLTPETIYYAAVKADCPDEEKWSEVITFKTDVACPKPQVSVETTPVNAVVSWTGYGESYDLEWAEAPATRDGGVLLQYDNGTYATSIGSYTSGTRTWGVMYPAGMLEGNKTLSKVYLRESSNISGDYTINIYSGGDDAPETLVGTETVTPGGSSAMVEITLTTPVSIDPSQNLWITVTATGTYVMTACANQYTMPVYQVNNPNNQWWLQGGAWSNMGEDNESLAEYGWMIRGLVEGYDETDFDWNPESGLTSGEFTIDPLESSTNYVVRVKSDCGQDGESAWAWAWFTTPTACDASFDLEATDITCNSATLNWIGYQESFNVRYRIAKTALFEEDFENGIPSTWTTIDNDTTNLNDWLALSDITDVYSYYQEIPEWAHSGSNAAMSPSFANGIGAFATDQYLVTPQLELNGTLIFYATSEYEDPDTYEVLLSLSGTNIEDFTITLQAMGPATYQSWDEVSIDLSEYAGRQGYIAIHHVATDKYFLVIDDFGLYDIGGEDDWIYTTADTLSVTINNLEPVTEYEWQVQGINNSCDSIAWSEMATFTTAPMPTQTIELAGGYNWFSTNLEITLNNLQDALVNALPEATSIKITAPDGKNSTYNGSRWRTPSGYVWKVSQMYIIQCPSNCEVTLQGLPIDPAQDTITIVNGYNWIGFPLSESMSVATAFAGFGVNNDKISSQLGTNTTFRNGSWKNPFDLEPGHGYIFKSVASSPRSFNYPTPTGRQSVGKTEGKPTSLLLQNLQMSRKVKDNDSKKVYQNTIDIDILSNKVGIDIFSKMKK